MRASHLLWTCQILGSFLLILNLFGLLFPKNPVKLSPDKLSDPVFGRRRHLESLRVLGRCPGELPLPYLKRIFQWIADHVVHHESHPVPWRENYWLAFAGHMLKIPYFAKYEYYSASRALRQGYGFCSQISLIVCYYLHRAQIPAYQVAFQGHVIAYAPLEEGSYCIDADYNRLFPSTLHHISQQVTTVYADCPADKQQKLIEIFQTDYRLLGRRAFLALLWLEQALYWAKWVCPITLILIFGNWRLC